MQYDDMPDVVNPHEIPNPHLDWAHASRINGFAFEYSINIGADGSINCDVHLSSPIMPEDSNTLLGHQINNLVKTAPDGYQFTDALIDHENLHAYFNWQIPGGQYA